MALLQSQINIIRNLVTEATITDAQAVDLLSASSGGFSSTQVAFIQGLGLATSVEEALLATNRSTQEQVEEEIAQAKAYLKAGNYVEARRWIVVAEMTMASMPDYQLGNREVEYREGIRFVKHGIADLEKVDPANASSVGRSVLTRYQRR